MSYRDATEYCHWAGGEEGNGGEEEEGESVSRRLPTEHEWEYAARAGRHNESYPWGNSILKAIISRHIIFDNLKHHLVKMCHTISYLITSCHITFHHTVTPCFIIPRTDAMLSMLLSAQHLSNVLY
jgi:Sulfatase-modifying factor enzyme 1